MDDSMLASESDLKFAVDNVVKVDEKHFERRDDLTKDLNQHQQQSSHSLHADFRYEISDSLPEKSYPVPTESDHDYVIETKPDHDQERTQSPLKDNNYYQGEMDELHGSNFLNTSYQSKSQTFHYEMGIEDSAHSQESPLTENADLGAGEENDSDLARPTAAPLARQANNIVSEKSQYDLIKSSIDEVEREASDLQTGKSLSSPKSHWWDDEPKKDDSPGEDRKPCITYSDLQSLRRTTRGSISPRTRRPMSNSPEGSRSPHHSPNGHKHLPSQHSSQDPLYAPRSRNQKVPSSPEMSELCKEVLLDHASPTRQTSASTRGIQQHYRHKEGSALKHISTSPKSHHSPPSHRGRDRLETRSPIRHRDSYGYQRNYRDRSRSRSPYSRAHHRSTRQRLSPRQRSPIPEYHSPRRRSRIPEYRSPRRRSPIPEHRSPRRRSPFPEYRSHHRSPRRTHWSPPPNRKTGLGKPGRNLFVAGFSFMTTERDLERKFSRFGRVRDIRIVRDKRSGDSRGFGFLTLERDEDADAAIRALDETEWNGRIILVEKSKT